MSSTHCILQNINVWQLYTSVVPVCAETGGCGVLYLLKTSYMVQHLTLYIVQLLHSSTVWFHSGILCTCRKVCLYSLVHGRYMLSAIRSLDYPRESTCCVFGYDNFVVMCATKCLFMYFGTGGGWLEMAFLHYFKDACCYVSTLCSWEYISHGHVPDYTCTTSGECVVVVQLVVTQKWNWQYKLTNQKCPSWRPI